MTILLVDDHDIVRRALRDWLGIVFPHIQVVEAASGEEAVALLETVTPHLVVMDITLPGMTGLEAIRCMKSMIPGAHIVVLTVHDDNIYRTCAKAAGASAYVPKWSLSSELIPALTPFISDNADLGGYIKS